jgi:hypothetical protein
MKMDSVEHRFPCMMSRPHFLVRCANAFSLIEEKMAIPNFFFFSSENHRNLKSRRLKNVENGQSVNATHSIN